MKRKIINIDRDKCNGCGLCVEACHEGAIVMVDGKAKLISDQYCDGLGDCLPACPVDAIKIEEREAAAYNEELVKQKMAEREASKEKEQKIKVKVNSVKMGHGGGCPGSRAMKIEQNNTTDVQSNPAAVEAPVEMKSQLSQWPVQLSLINPAASYLEDADILIAADCVAYAYGNFHNEFIKDKVTIIGCPKLDDNQYYEEKLTQMFSSHQVRSITVVRMEVPCCGGIIRSVKNAILRSGNIVPYSEVVIGIDGSKR
jgi:Fe-S-cluster-containing hydrogenase component 2